jgi:hypothetical protein
MEEEEEEGVHRTHKRTTDEGKRFPLLIYTRRGRRSSDGSEGGQKQQKKEIDRHRS